MAAPEIHAATHALTSGTAVDVEFAALEVAVVLWAVTVMVTTAKVKKSLENILSDLTEIVK